jgi:hypothetical protein
MIAGVLVVVLMLGLWLAVWWHARQMRQRP